MNFISNNDVYADTLSTAMILTLPFMSIGGLGHPTVLYISSTIGIIFLCCFLIRLFITLKNGTTVKSAGWLTELMSQLAFPYAFALSSLILITGGVDASDGLWFALGCTILILVCTPLFYRRKSKSNHQE